MHFDSPSHEPSTAASCLADWPQALRKPKHTLKVKKSLRMMLRKISIIAETLQNALPSFEEPRESL